MEIKKAYNQFKKEIEKECGIKYGFTMTVKQIANRTATYCSSTIVEFDNLIDQDIKTANKIMTYNTWTEEEKINRYNEIMDEVKHLNELKVKYGTQYNRAVDTMNKIKNSKAFAKFQTEVGKTELSIETANDCWHIRFNY